jgi:hypothetical protein
MGVLSGVVELLLAQDDLQVAERTLWALRKSDQFADAVQQFGLYWLLVHRVSTS